MCYCQTDISTSVSVSTPVGVAAFFFFFFFFSPCSAVVVDYGPSHFTAERSWWVLVPRGRRERETDRQTDRETEREYVCVRQTYIQRKRHSSFELFMC